MEEKRILKNGISVYSYKNPESHSFHLSLFVKAGSMYESENECGITHFFEHIAIRNVNAVMGGKLYSYLDRHGIEFNASTYSEMVQFFASGAVKNFRVGAEAVAALFSPIVLNAEEINAERRRIKAEIRELDEATSLSCFSQRAVWGGTSLSRPIAGTLGSVSKIGQKKLEDYRSRIFTRENLFLYLTGNFSDYDLEYLSSLIEKINLPAGSARENIAPIPKSFCNRECAVLVKNADFTKLKFNFDIDIEKVGVCECDLIYEILFGGYASQFFMEMSEKRGLFYDLVGNVERYKNIGVMSFGFEVKENDLYSALGIVVELLKKYKKYPVPEEDCMKAGFVDNGDMLLDEPRELNFTFAYDNYILSLGYLDIEKRKAAYRSICPERLMQVINEIFKTSNLTLAIKGRVKKIDTERIKGILLGLDE